MSERGVPQVLYKYYPPAGVEYALEGSRSASVHRSHSTMCLTVAISLITDTPELVNPSFAAALGLCALPRPQRII
jgi:hypothetical protein